MVVGNDCNRLRPCSDSFDNLLFDVLANTSGLQRKHRYVNGVKEDEPLRAMLLKGGARKGLWHPFAEHTNLCWVIKALNSSLLSGEGKEHGQSSFALRDRLGVPISARQGVCATKLKHNVCQDILAKEVCGLCRGDLQ